MISILIVSHGNFGEELINSSEMIIGKVQNVECVSFKLGDKFVDLCKRVEKSINKLSTKDLIVFTDMYGGSTFNSVDKLMKNNNFYHISGVNLPLFMDIALNKDSYNMNDLIEKIIKNGKKSIVFVNDKFLFE